MMRSSKETRRRFSRLIARGLVGALALTVAGLGASCVQKAAPADVITPAAPVELVPVYEPPLLPEDLSGKLSFENFESTGDSAGAKVGATVVNLSGIEPVTIQLCARFSDAQGATLFDTAWTSVTIPPTNRHQFYAETTERGAASGRILLRQVLPPGSTPKQGASANR